MGKFASGQDEANPCSIGDGERALTTHLALAGFPTLVLQERPLFGHISNKSFVIRLDIGLNLSLRGFLAFVNNQPFDLTLYSLGLKHISSTSFPVFSSTRLSLSLRRDEEAAPKRSNQLRLTENLIPKLTHKPGKILKHASSKSEVN